jgi:hypothetical protein
VSTPCPRCGYDLSGTVATWTDRCPLDGQCAECGLPFAWGRVLALAEHPWLFEYHWRSRPLRRLARTWLEALRPSRFWREVRLTDPVRLRPMAVVLLGLFLAMMTAGYAMILAFNYEWFRWWSGRVLPAGSAPVGTRSWPDFLAHGLRVLAEGIVTAVPGFLVAVLATPLVFALLPHTLARARVRPAHIVRIWFYSLLLPFTVLGSWAAVQAVLAAVGWGKAATTFNPWLLAEGISPWQHPVLAWIAPVLPDLGLLLLYAGWGACWSWCGCRFYLRLERPGRVVAALTLIVVLASYGAHLWVWVIISSPS